MQWRFKKAKNGRWHGLNPMNIFIDTNILLSFYHLTSEDLEELKKLGVLLRKKSISLFLPSQVTDEFKRNRERKISDAITILEKQKLNLQFPQLCKDYEEYKNLRKQQKDYEKNHAKLVDRIKRDALDEKLNADYVIKELFHFASKIDCKEDIIRHARHRNETGCPPGKNNSIGDAINWEALLSGAPKREDMFFVTDDLDYVSAIDKNIFSAYLHDEWKRQMSSNLIYYKRLSSFFVDHFPDIKLASEYEIDLLISDLARSPNYTQTHNIIKELSRFSVFNSEQINRIVEIAVNNTQVAWIVTDDDLSEFLYGVLNGADHDELEQNNLHRLFSNLEGEEGEPDEELF